MSKLIAPCVVLTLLLSACLNPVQPSPRSTSTPSTPSTLTPIPPTATLTPTLTLIPSPTATPEPLGCQPPPEDYTRLEVNNG